MTVDPAHAPTPRRATINRPGTGYGRIPVCDVYPVIDLGAYPAKAVVDELIPIRATVFREGHDAVCASVVLTDPQGGRRRVDMKVAEPKGLDRWEAWVRLDQEGDWTFHVEGWDDAWHTWQHNASIKFASGQDLPLVCMEGRKLFEEAASAARQSGDDGVAVLLETTATLLSPERDIEELLEVTNMHSIDRAMRGFGPRGMLTPTQEFPIRVDRKGAQFTSWYEFFPRSQYARQDDNGHWHSGTLDSSHAMLDRIASLGFNVAYVPPVHPIGFNNRKGRNNTLTPGPQDPGSPWAVGSSAGGHDAIHPDLGDLDAWDRFVEKAHSVGLEVALDFALQASPDHPWLTEHPEWFTTRLDGTIAYAENPPKKYQDIYPINFDNDPEGIYNEVLRLVNFWIDHGVTIFRVDNPHTKPLEFWDWLLERVHETHPEILFQAEAFTRPPMMQALGKVGFQLSYCYFVWRTTKKELSDYLKEVSSATDHLMRPNFFTNTPDINPLFTRSGKMSAFAIRIILATMMSPAWGIYSGFELLEHKALLPGTEEYDESERFEYRPRDYDAQPNLNTLVGKLNHIRNTHPALQQIRQTTIQDTAHDQVFAFSKIERHDRVIVVCSLNPDAVVESTLTLNMESLGLAGRAIFRVRDELTGHEFEWGPTNYVRLTPENPAHICTVLD